MYTKRQFILLVTTILLVCFFSIMTLQTSFALDSDVNISANAAIMLESGTNSVLYSKNAHTRLPMASTTKVMTALVAIEKGNPSDIVKTADEAYGIEGSSIYLAKNERISLKDLLYGLMLRSGNDASIAIAVHIGGNVQTFVDMMNAKAQELGLTNTHFTNPNGLPDDDHYTSAYDLGIICSAALSNETFKTIVGTQYYTAQTGEVKRTMMNKNKLLWQYDGALGIKTGYTQKAGKCLTFAAQRNGMTVIGVVLNCPDMFPDSMKLMDYCFENYEMYKLISKDSIVMRSMIGNSSRLAAFAAASDISVPVKKSDGAKFTTQIQLNPNLTAPLKQGATVGVLTLYNGSTPVTSTALVCNENVGSTQFSYFFNRIVMQFIS